MNATTNHNVIERDAAASVIGNPGPAAMNTLSPSKHRLVTWLRSSVEMTAEQWERINGDFAFRKELHDSCLELLHNAHEKGDRSALEALHEALAFIYELDFGTTGFERVDCEMQPVLRDIAATLETGVLKHEMKAISEETLTSYPTRGSEFVGWLKRLISTHRCSMHPFYQSFLAQTARAVHLKFFLAQETNLDPRFDDILALIQLGQQGNAKMEIANNYYDEMGNGQHAQVHSHLFKRTLDEMNIDERFVRESMILDGRITGNISACLALHRRHYYKAIGYFGVTEYLAPRRSKQFVAAWKRNNLSEAGIVYHDMHIEIDARHARGWFDNVIAPLIDKDPRLGREIALGAVIRLNSSAKYLDALLATMPAVQAIEPAAPVA